MRNVLVLFLVLAVVFGLSFETMAQQAAPGTPVTITGAHGDAAVRCDTANSSGQQTLTLQNPGPGQSAYVTMIAIWGLATGVPTAATPTVSTITGIAGTTPSLTPLASVYPAAGAQGSVSGGPVPLATPMKGLAGTAVAIVGPTAITNMNQAVEACYYFAP